MYQVFTQFSTDEYTDIVATDKQVLDAAGRNSTMRDVISTESLRVLRWDVTGFDEAVNMRRRLLAAGFKAQVRER